VLPGVVYRRIDTPPPEAFGMEEKVRESFVSGVVGSVIGLVVTYVVSLVVPTPWELGQILVAAGFASFFASIGGAYGRGRPSCVDKNIMKDYEV